jgi:hypothetical protein
MLNEAQTLHLPALTGQNLPLQLAIELAHFVVSLMQSRMLTLQSPVSTGPALSLRQRKAAVEPFIELFYVVMDH